MPLTAQAVNGTVVLPDGSTPASGVIVLFENASGVVVHRALTGQRGTFTTEFKSGGDYRARVLRVGYKPTELPGVRVAPTGTTTLRIVLTASAVTLPVVSVRGADVCRGDRAEGALVAEVWEEARKALIAGTSSVPMAAR